MPYESVPCWLREMIEAVKKYPLLLEYIPDHLKTQGMCDDAVSKGSYNLKYVPGHLKTEKMCKKAFEDDPEALQFVSNWFVTQEQLDIWLHDDYWYHDDEMIEWYNAYKKRKDQKAKIKGELLPIAWHPDRVVNWCMSEDEKEMWK